MSPSDKFFTRQDLRDKYISLTEDEISELAGDVIDTTDPQPFGKPLEDTPLRVVLILAVATVILMALGALLYAKFS